MRETNRRRTRLKVRVLYLALATALTASAGAASQSLPVLASDYSKFVVYSVDRRSLWEKALNYLGLTNHDVGRSFALIAGVSRYPNMILTEQRLTPAEEDVRKAVLYLQNMEFFDEIVVLQNGDVTDRNLRYFLSSYFPDRLAAYPKSRFLFAYSGHGMTADSEGYILTAAARSLSDRENSLPLSGLRSYFDRISDAAYHSLVMINSCYSGAFVRQSFGNALMAQQRGAHAITAGGSGERTWHDHRLGSGSVFFEKVFAGLDGRADTLPKRGDGTVGDGIITVEELFAYLRQEIQLFTAHAQNPQIGDLSGTGSRGSFFFLNRTRTVAAGLAPQFRPDRARSFGGPAAEEQFAIGRQFHREQEYEKARAAFEGAAALGSSEAAIWLGAMHERGTGGSPSYTEALRWYSKAGELGDTLGYTQVGRMHLFGIGVRPSAAEAVRFFERASNAGDVGATAFLGDAYRDGRGVSKDYARARELLTAAANAGVARAMGELGEMFAFAQGGPQDPVAALQWYERAIRAGDLNTYHRVGDLYLGGRGVEKNYAAAVEWYEKGVEAGSVAAIYDLANMYFDGRGVKKDRAKAATLFAAAADGGDVRAMSDLGQMYERGLGVQRDHARAITFYRSAAEKGQPLSMFLLAQALEKGRGTTKNVEEAVHWYRVAAAHGMTEARDALKRLRTQ